MKMGTVILVGAGPGGPEYLTLRGWEALQSAEAVVYDRLVAPDILALIPEQAEKINVGKQAGTHPVPQEEINRILLKLALRGKQAVRLKGGDPFVFGRGGEELELLREHGVPFEVVPGITSAVGALSSAGIPVTHRDCASSFHVFTAHFREGKPLSLDYPALARLPGTLIFLMGVSALPELVQGLLNAGMPPETPSAVVENGTRPNQRSVICPLNRLREKAEEEGLHSPAVICVGDVCSFHSKFDWFSRRPLFGRKLLLTRPAGKGKPAPEEADLTQRLERLGAEVVKIPCSEIRPLPMDEEKKEILSKLSQFQWLALTSESGVKQFFPLLFEAGMDARDLQGLRIGAAGPRTAAALEKMGIRCNAIPEQPGGQGLALTIRSMSPKGGSVLWCGARSPADGLERLLQEGGFQVVRLPLYETVLPDQPDPALISALQEGCVPLFASGSAIRGFLQKRGETDISGMTAFCLGPETARAAKQAGMKPLYPERASLDQLAEVILRAWSQPETKKGGSKENAVE